MNKKVIITVVIVLALIVGAIIYFSMSKSSSPTRANNTSEQPTQPPVQNEMPDYVKAMQGAGEVKCTYDVNGVTQTSYIKNGKIRMEITTNGVTTNTLMLNKVVYSWPSNSKKGFMMDTSTLSVSVTPSQQESNYKDMDSLKKDFETYKPTCTHESLADSMFEKPSDVTFTDYGKMMNEMKSKIPSNVTIPEGYKIPGQ